MKWSAVSKTFAVAFLTLGWLAAAFTFFVAVDVFDVPHERFRETTLFVSYGVASAVCGILLSVAGKVAGPAEWTKAANWCMTSNVSAIVILLASRMLS